jgi:transposase
MWKPKHRRAADRTGLRYPSDLTDAEWVIVEPMIPPAKRGGRRRSVNVRGVLNGISYVLWTGCQWKALPKDLPPKSRCMIILSFGTGTAHWNAFTTSYRLRCVSRQAERQARQ